MDIIPYYNNPFLEPVSESVNALPNTNPFLNAIDDAAYNTGILRTSDYSHIAVNTLESKAPTPTATSVPSVPFIGSNVHLIPNFCGDDSVTVEKFIDSLKTVSHLSAWSESHTLCAARLRISGTAGEYIVANPHILDSFEVFQKSLKERFTPKISLVSLERSFISCLQQPLESVQEFSTRLRRLAIQLREANANPNTEATRKMIEDRLFVQFLAGLRQDIGRFVLVRNPINILQAEEHALQEEANARNYSAVPMNLNPTQNCPGCLNSNFFGLLLQEKLWHLQIENPGA